MALLAGEHLPRARRERAQRDALVELHMVADHGRFANDDAGAMVDEEILADLRAGVDVDAGAGMRVFSHDARNEGHAFQIQLVRHAIDVDGEQPGIAENDLLAALRGGITLKFRLHIL